MSELTTAQSLRMIPVARWGWEVGWDRKKASQPFLCIWILEAKNGLTFFYFQVSGRLCRSFFQLVPIFSCWPLVTGDRKFWSVVVYTCFVSGIIYPKKAVRALITFSQTPQLEGFAALAPRTAYPAPGPAFYRRRSNVLCHRKSLCLSVFCLSSVTSLHPLSALLFIVIRRVNEWWRQCRCRWQH